MFSVLQGHHAECETRFLVAPLVHSRWPLEVIDREALASPFSKLPFWIKQKLYSPMLLISECSKRCASSTAPSYDWRRKLGGARAQRFGFRCEAPSQCFRNDHGRWMVPSKALYECEVLPLIVLRKVTDCSSSLAAYFRTPRGTVLCQRGTTS